MKRYFSAILFAVAFFFALVAMASAHAKLDHCTPEPGSAVTTPPAQVRCWFTEELDSKASTLAVTDASGASADNGDGRLDLNDAEHKQMFATLKPLSVGVYKVTWHAVTPDDNGISDGSFYFGVGQVVVPTNVPTPTFEAALQSAAQATNTPAAPTPTAAATATPVGPSAGGVATPTPAPLVAATPAASNTVPVVVVLGVLQAALVIGVLVWLYRSNP